jgi:hypothetical protein
MVENLVKESDILIIFETLMRTQSNKDAVMLWQLDTDGKRLVKNATLAKIQTTKRLITFKSLDDKQFQFDKTQNLFIRCQDRGLLFKASIERIEGGIINISVPAEVHIIENRTSPRSDIMESPAVKIVLEKADDEIVGRMRFEFAIRNISRTGAAVLFSVSKLRSFNLGNKLLIKSIGNVKFDESHLSTIVYLKEEDPSATGLTARFHKMGLAFDNIISEEKLLDILENYGM